MAESFTQATTARTIPIAGGVVVIDEDIAQTQTDPGESLGPLFRASHGPVRWAILPVDGAGAPVDAAGLLIDAVLVYRHLDAAGELLGFSRHVSTAEFNAGTRTASHFILTDTTASPGALAYLTVLSVNNIGTIPAIKIVAVDGLSLTTGSPS